MDVYYFDEAEVRFDILDVVREVHDLLSPEEHIAIASVLFGWIESKMTDHQIAENHAALKVFSSVLSAYADMDAEDILDICDKYYDFVNPDSYINAINAATQSVAHI